MKTIVLEAVARGWCDPANAHKVVDPELAEAITREVVAALAALPGGGVDGWQPIETALAPDVIVPLVLLGWAPSWSHPMPMEWSQSRNKWRPSVDDLDASRDGVIDWAYGTEQPTHWRRMPDTAALSPTPNPHEADQS